MSEFAAKAGIPHERPPRGVIIVAGKMKTSDWPEISFAYAAFLAVYASVWYYLGRGNVATRFARADDKTGHSLQN